MKMGIHVYHEHPAELTDGTWSFVGPSLLCFVLHAKDMCIPHLGVHQVVSPALSASSVNAVGNGA